MLRPSLQAKIANLVVTDKSVEYEGSLGLPDSVLERSGLKPGQKVLVINTANAERFETYLIRETGGTCSLRGGAARLGEVGDELIVMAFVWLSAEEDLEPRVVRVDSNNQPKGGR